VQPATAKAHKATARREGRTACEFTHSRQPVPTSRQALILLRMDQKAPRSLLWSMALLAAAAFVFSVYLEANQAEWLKSHPIMVNLISGMIGFPVATLTAAVFFNWLVDMDKARRLHRPVMEEWQRLSADTWATFDGLGTPDIDEIDPTADKDWLPDAVAIRASGLAFIPVARRFAQRVGILDAGLRAILTQMQDRLTALPVMVDQAGYMEYVKMWSELISLTSEVDSRHYALMRKRVRARTASASPV
jgi:hypothetical protein